MTYLLIDPNDNIHAIANRINRHDDLTAQSSIASSISGAIYTNNIETAFVLLMAYALSQDFQVTERVGLDFLALTNQTQEPH